MGWWIGYADKGHEFAVQDAIAALGSFAWVAREFSTVRPPTKRRHVLVVRPLPDWGRRLVINCTDDQWHAMHNIKHLSPSFLRVARQWVERADRDIKLRDGTWQECDGDEEREWVPGEVWLRKGDLLRPDGVGAFMERIDRDYAEREARFNAGETLAAYQPGDALRIIAGPLAGQLARFERIVEGATDIEDRMRASMALMGGQVGVTLDPLHVVREAAE